MSCWPRPTARCSASLRRAADLAGRALRVGQEPAPEGAPAQPGRLDTADRPPRPGRAGHRLPSGTGPGAGAGPGREDGDLAVQLPARHRRGDGLRRRRAAGHRDHPGGLRRRAPGQLRFLRLPGGGAGDRPERLRRGAPRLLGVGPAPAGGQRLGGRPGELRDRGAVPDGRAGLRRRLPGRGPLPGRAAAADAQLQPARRGPAARDSHREVAAGGDRTVGQAGPDPHQ